MCFCEPPFETLSNLSGIGYKVFLTRGARLHQMCGKYYLDRKSFPNGWVLAENHAEWKHNHLYGFHVFKDEQGAKQHSWCEDRPNVVCQVEYRGAHLLTVVHFCLSMFKQPQCAVVIAREIRLK